MQKESQEKYSKLKMTFCRIWDWKIKLEPWIECRWAVGKVYENLNEHKRTIQDAEEAEKLRKKGRNNVIMELGKQMCFGLFESTDIAHLAQIKSKICISNSSRIERPAFFSVNVPVGFLRSAAPFLSFTFLEIGTLAHPKNIFIFSTSLFFFFFF